MKAFTGGQTRPLSRRFLFGALDWTEENDSGAGLVGSAPRHNKFNIPARIL